MSGEHTRKAIWAQPEWLRQVPTDQLLPGSKILFTGCGTSFHAAQTGGDAVQALELVLRPERDADVLVAISHEGTTKLTLEAVQAWEGEKWVITGAPASPIAAACDHVVVAAPEIEKSWCHTASYTSAVAARPARRGREKNERTAGVEAERPRPERAAPPRACPGSDLNRPGRARP